jgi:TRAP-type mannitol/chloroaromatic compound transport system substrate-binding protein
MLSRSPNVQGLALERLRTSGVAIKQWAPELLKAFRDNTDIVLKEQAQRDPDFAAALANQRAFIAQGAGWRTLSRLP